MKAAYLEKYGGPESKRTVNTATMLFIERRSIPRDVNGQPDTDQWCGM